MSKDAEQPEDFTPKETRVMPAAALAGAAALVIGVSVGFFAAPIAFTPKSASEKHVGADAYPEDSKSDAQVEKENTRGSEQDVSYTATAKTRAAAHGEKPESGCSGDCGDGFSIVGENGYFAPEPLVISIRPGAGLRHLKVAVVIETTPDSRTHFVENALRIRDALIAYLRAVDPAMLEDPDAFDKIRAAIGHRVATVVGSAPVKAVLITDFILT